MTITPEKHIPAAIELYDDEADVLIDCKLLCERIKRMMDETGTETITGATYEGKVTITVQGVEHIIELTNKLFNIAHIKQLTSSMQKK